MKKTKIASLTALVTTALLMASCKPKIEDLCDCTKKSANDFMLRGEYPEPLTKVAIPCSELADKFDKNSSEYHTNVTALESQIRDSIDHKGLFLVDGEIPKFPSLSITHSKLREEFAQDFKSAQYKYWKTHLTVDNVNYIGTAKNGGKGLKFGGELNGSVLKLFSFPVIWIDAENANLPQSSTDDFVLADLKGKRVVSVEDTPDEPEAKKYHLIFEFLTAYEKSDLGQAAYYYRALLKQFPEVTQDLIAGNYLKTKSVPTVCKIEGDCGNIENTAVGVVMNLLNAKYTVVSQLDVTALKPVPIKNFDPSKYKLTEEEVYLKEEEEKNSLWSE